MSKKNTMVDLHDHLMEQLETLADPDLSGEALDEQIKRSEAVTAVAETIIDNAGTMLRAQKQAYDMNLRVGSTPLLPPVGRDGQ